MRRKAIAMKNEETKRPVEKTVEKTLEKLSISSRNARMLSNAITDIDDSGSAIGPTIKSALDAELATYHEIFSKFIDDFNNELTMLKSYMNTDNKNSYLGLGENMSELSHIFHEAYDICDMLSKSLYNLERYLELVRERQGGNTTEK